MVTKLEWSAKAQTNLNKIFIFYKKKSEQAAIKLFNKLLDAADTLLIFPEAGKVEPMPGDISTCYRSLVVEKHFKLIYFVEKDTVRIAAVWDCRRNPSAFRRFVGL